MRQAPVILWFRRDLRLADHAALGAVVATGRPIVPVFIHDETVDLLGAAAKWRLGEGLRVFAGALEAIGARLILRRGAALDVLCSIVGEVGAGAVFWQRVYDRDGIERDRAVKAALKSASVEARSFAGATVFEPWDVATGSGTPYKVFTPFWRAIRGRQAGGILAPPDALAAPETWPVSDSLEDWAIGAAMDRGAAIVARHAGIGEAAAWDRLDRFRAGRLENYVEDRDYPARHGTSGLSENLAWGEISPRAVWLTALGDWQAGRPGAEKFLSELGWREFAWHLMYHAPDLDRANWRPGWDAFPWRGDSADAERWRRGLTGEPFVDAAMREMYVTGRMHNRARMIAASYLTKNLLTDWRVGLAWFAECLTDWDPAANALGWQWVAGSGPDAAPFFRIFNPRLQAERFDPDGAYRASFIAEGQSAPPNTAREYFEAVPRSWHLSPGDRYPAPLADLSASRKRALDAYGGMDAAPAR
ncbi:deoxyribodipyrimidine photo-lyase [Defluviimonas sp. D31]|uniref:cryptochrome/photolyase family protein n=1 Tax=Defluviimonas sp. D31 TaxID=3083253 RepID=UPI00296FCBDC|nr:deoxyribodipyrimidine photo-lyase [Defluviimonas sp. D31]MDW4551414.1 deoxyribodipyrimidine photo-lyase [Defluviimonas sp. D31]